MKKVEPPEAKKENEAGKTPTSLRNKEACHSIITALLQRIARVKAQRTRKSSKKTLLQEFSPYIPPPKTVEKTTEQKKRHIEREQ
jgi:uncharacterized small protein (DUF1192 family)